MNAGPGRPLLLPFPSQITDLADVYLVRVTSRFHDAVQYTGYFSDQACARPKPRRTEDKRTNGTHRRHGGVTLSALAPARVPTGKLTSFSRGEISCWGVACRHGERKEAIVAHASRGSPKCQFDGHRSFIPVASPGRGRAREDKLPRRSRMAGGPPPSLPPSLPFSLSYSVSLCLALSDHGCQVPTLLAPACAHPDPRPRRLRVLRGCDAFDGSIGDAACRTAKDDASNEEGRKEGRTEARMKKTKYSARTAEGIKRGRGRESAHDHRGCGLRMGQMLKWI